MAGPLGSRSGPGQGRDRGSASSRCPTSTRSSTPRSASPKPASWTTTPGSPRSWSPTWPAGPLTLVRAPDGVEGERFFEKRCPPHAPDWVRRGGELDSCIVDDAADPGLAREPRRARAAHPPARGRRARDADGRRVRPRPGTTGDRPRLRPRRARPPVAPRPARPRRVRQDLRVEGPAPERAAERRASRRDRRDHQARSRSRSATCSPTADPDRVTVDMAKAARPATVFVDWSQNDDHKTTVSVYSLRIRPRPTVSTPVTWDEVSDALDSEDEDALDVRHRPLPRARRRPRRPLRREPHRARRSSPHSAEQLG